MAKERGYFMDVSIVMRDKVFCLSTTVDYSVVNVVSSIVVSLGSDAFIRD